jgi:hypothetical protein
MSYTGCWFNGRCINVDGTSYACIVAMAITEARRLSNEPERKQKWEAKLRQLRKDSNEMPTNMIGGDFDDIISSEAELQEFTEALRRTESRIHSFGDTIPNEVLREAIEQDDRGGYIQDIEYRPKPFLETAQAILKLLQGTETV